MCILNMDTLDNTGHFALHFNKGLHIERVTESFTAKCVVLGESEPPPHVIPPFTSSQTSSTFIALYKVFNYQLVSAVHSSGGDSKDN